MSRKSIDRRSFRSKSRPSQARLLATNATCLGQGFTYDQNIIAFQFHPETTYEWAVECANDPIIPIGKFCQSKEELIVGAKKYQPALQKWYHQTLDRFVNVTPTAEIKIKTQP